MSERRKRKQSQFGILFWVAIILFIVVLVMVYMGPMNEVLNSETVKGILESNGQGDFFNNEANDSMELVVNEPLVDSISNRDTAVKTPVQEPEPVIEAPAEPVNQQPQAAEEIINSTTETPAAPVAEEKPAVEEKPAPREAESNEPEWKNFRNASLYYISLNAAGEPVVQKTSVKIGYNSSPLTRTIENLFQGIGISSNLMTLVPPGTRLNEVWIKDGIAFIDVTDAVQFNPMGRAGHLAMLEQLVYTATEYSTVKGVQLLINGNKKDFLGSEGVSIKTPLKRSDF